MTLQIILTHVSRHVWYVMEIIHRKTDEQRGMGKSSDALVLVKNQNSQDKLAIH